MHLSVGSIQCQFKPDCKIDICTIFVKYDLHILVRSTTYPFWYRLSPLTVPLGNCRQFEFSSVLLTVKQLTNQIVAVAKTLQVTQIKVTALFNDVHVVIYNQTCLM
jgi:hypothetical protein